LGVSSLDLGRHRKVSGLFLFRRGLFYQRSAWLSCAQFALQIFRRR
jgi:hypothetical protein